VRLLAILLVLAIILGPSAALGTVGPDCCVDPAEGGAGPAACDLYCPWVGVNFNNFFYLAFIGKG